MTSEVTSINPSSVDVDEDFTVGVLIDNCGDSLPDNVSFEITRFSDDIEIKEPLLSTVGKMGYANSRRFITYHMRTSPYAVPGEHVFQTKLAYYIGDSMVEKEGNFSITVNTRKPDLMISRVYTTPEIVYVNDKIILTIDVENAGSGEARDVQVELTDLEIDGVKQKYLGKIDSDESLPARFVFQPVSEGIYGGTARVSYRYGGSSEMYEFPFEIQVFKEQLNYYYIAGLVLLLLILIAVLVRKIKPRSK